METSDRMDDRVISMLSRFEQEGSVGIVGDGMMERLALKVLRTLRVVSDEDAVGVFLRGEHAGYAQGVGTSFLAEMDEMDLVGVAGVVNVSLFQICEAELTRAFGMAPRRAEGVKFDVSRAQMEKLLAAGSESVSQVASVVGRGRVEVSGYIYEGGDKTLELSVAWGYPPRCGIMVYERQDGGGSRRYLEIRPEEIIPGELRDLTRLDFDEIVGRYEMRREAVPQS